jgi:isochorismate synthase EntC
VSATEILDELPKLSAEEIDAIFFRAAALRQHFVSASPELLAAIDEADASFAADGGKPVDEVEAAVKSWLTK